jgi:predicted TIM-barrel fold metal-dependent hydrolase
MTIVAPTGPGAASSYAAGRFVHDADAHLFETDGFYEAYADPGMRERLAALDTGSRGRDLAGSIERLHATHHAAPRAAETAGDVLLHKNLDALGAFDPRDRVTALDQLGFQSQLIFTTTYLATLTRLDRGDDEELSVGATRAHNRGMVDFCSVDRRLLPVCWVPTASVERAAELGREAIAMGAAALMIPSICPRRQGPSHVGYDALWAAAQDAGVPIVFHVGGGRPMVETYKENGLPPVPDFHGGDDNFTSVSYMAIPEAPMQTLATMIFDGVLDRFPALRIGVIEQGASWVPGWMRSMDSAASAFIRNEERLQALSLRPSEFVERQVRVTPYPHEDAGWIIRNVGPDICMFSSDYPHVEGGRNPLKRFDAALRDLDDAALRGFYSANFADMMGGSVGTG